ncbi:MAG: LacI family DNA-binding transcriptional regulator [Acidimicrobiia bacterium]|nr:LacI family DNA-binding transcriptional regulator [Acidimicrobiia bacterium]
MENGERLAATTLESVAELAGVSRSTVSRVLNNDPHVRTATREHVLEIVERAQYVRNRAARNLVSGRTGMIGVVISVDLSDLFSDPFFASLLKEIYGAARKQELVVSVWLLEDAGDKETIDQITRGLTLDGAIVAAGRTDDPIVDALAVTGKPFVLLGRPGNDPNVSYVDIDNHNAERNLTAHLLRLGRQRIATVAGPTNSIAGIDRLNGYLDALREAGIDPDADLIFESDFSAASAKAGTRQLMEHQPDAIVAANDVMAIAAMNELASMGVRVPDDVAVVGFDDVAGAGLANPPLTTVRQSISLLGSEAVRALTELIEDPSVPPRQIEIPTELIVRASCGAHSLQGENKQ